MNAIQIKHSFWGMLEANATPARRCWLGHTSMHFSILPVRSCICHLVPDRISSQVSISVAFT